jgi:hypothetical protein
VSDIKFTFDPQLGLIEEELDNNVSSSVVFKAPIVYVPSDPSSWTVVPSNLVQAVDYLAGGSSSLFAVANTSALGVVDDTAIDNGSVVSMLSVKNLWFLDKNSTLSTDGITVIATNSGTGRWIRMIQSHLSWRKQAAWYIDQASGDDENDGSTAGTALASHEEFQRRVADEDQPIDVDMVVTFTSDYTGDIENTVSVSQVTQYGSITYQGQRTVIFSGTVTAVTPWATGTTAGTFSDSALATSFTSSGGLNKLCVLTSGTNSGAASWLTRETVAKTIRYSGFFSDSTFAQSDPDMGDSYEVVSLTEITGKITQVGDGFTTFKNISLQPTGGFDAQIQIYGGYVAFTYCDIEITSSGGMQFSAGGTFGHGLFASKINVTAGTIRFFQTECTIYSCWFPSVIPFVTPGGRITLQDRSLGQALTGGGTIDKQFVAQRGGNLVITGEWCVLDISSATSRLIQAKVGGLIEVSGTVWGLGNTQDYLIEAKSGSKIIFTPPAASRFQGSAATVADSLVGNTTSTIAALPEYDLDHAAFIGET